MHGYVVSEDAVEDGHLLAAEDSAEGTELRTTDKSNSVSSHCNLMDFSGSSLWGNMDAIEMHGNHLPVVCGYYLLLNMGATFLKHRGSNRFSIHHSGRIALIFGLFFVVFIFVTNFISIGVAELCIHGKSQSQQYSNAECFANNLLFTLTLGLIVPCFYYILTFSGMLLSLVGLLYGGLILHEMASSWVYRFAMLRTGDIEDDIEDLGTVTVCGKVLSVSEVPNLIERDAYEHYLFIQEYVKQLSELWSPILVVVFFSALCLLGLCLYEILKDKGYQNRWVFFFIIFLCVFMILFPIYCIAYANSAMSAIHHCFHNASSPSNYKLIGGRDVWRQYLQDSSMYWCIFGLPITWGYLYSVLGTLVSAFVAVCFSLAASKL